MSAERLRFLRQTSSLRRGVAARAVVREDGMALVLALAVTAVLTILTVSMIMYVSSNQRGSSRSLAGQKALELAQAGLNDAEAVLASNYPSHTYPAGPANAVPAASQTFASGTASWSGTLTKDASGNWSWTLNATGTVNSPSAPGAVVTRSLSVQVPVWIPKNQVQSPQIWNWVYSGATGSPCDMTIQQSVQVTSPLYVAGNLCLQNTAKILQPTSVPGMIQNRLVVGGLLNQQQNQNTVGTNSTPLTEAHVLGGCTWAGEPHQTTHNPCITGNRTNVYATTFDTTTNNAPTLTPVDWTDAYVYSSPGPWQGCTTQSGTPPTFDTTSDIANQTTANPALYMNNNVSTVFNLVGSSYTCKTSTGELSWDNTAKVLTIKGSIFIDGSISVSSGSNTVARYSGTGVIYARGTILLKNTILCAVISGSNCDTANWDPSNGMLIMFANGNGSNAGPESQVSSGDGIQFVSASFQGGLYATNNIDISTTSLVQGPMISPRVIMPGQSGNLAFPPVVTIPDGTLTPSPPPVQLRGPVNWGG
jgi:Tfp pilus assembly protein PilX